MQLFDVLQARLFVTLFLLFLSLSVMTPSTRAQDDDDDDDDGDGDNDFAEDANDLGDGGFGFGMGSNNYEEMGGGLFANDDDSLDFMASKRRPSILPPFLRGRKNNDDNQVVINDQVQPMVNFNGQDFVQQEATGSNFPHPRHHPRFSQENDQDYDEDRRRRYSGYGDEHDVQSREEDTMHRQRSPEQDSFLAPLHRHPHEANFDVSQDFDRFPKGSYFGLDGFYGDSKLVHDRIFSPFKVETTSRKVPCDSDCDDEDNKKK